MSQPDQKLSTKHDRPYLVIDIPFHEKCLGLTYMGAAGGISGVASKEVIGASIKFLSLSAIFPECTGTLIGMVAFTQAAKIACDAWAEGIQPRHLILREKRAPRISL